MYTLVNTTSLKTIPSKTRFYVFAGVDLECKVGGFVENQKLYNCFVTYDACKREANNTNYWLGYCGSVDKGYETCNVIEFSPLKFKPVTTQSLKVVLRKKVA